jgi:putative transposase
MSNYKRWFVPGGMYFFTLATYARRPILTTEQGRNILRNAILEIRHSRPFNLFATVLLPDHWHMVMSLPVGDSDYATRLKRIKENFTQNWRRLGLPEANVSQSKRRRGERGIWQPRFWEHTITDETDLEGCVDYIHWNPRKHNLVSRVRDWQWSSFHRFVLAGQYSIDWGGEEPKSINRKRDWGE